MTKFEIVEFAKHKNVIEAYEGNLTAAGDALVETEAVETAAKAQLEKIKGLVCDYTDTTKREAYDKEVKKAKQVFTKFDDNAKAVKARYVEHYPKGIDRTRQSVKSVANPVFDELERPKKEIEAQNELVKRWEARSLPFDMGDIERELLCLDKFQPSKHSSQDERSEFANAKELYKKALEESLESKKAKEKAEKEAREQQAKEAERLRQQAAEQAKIAEEQRKAQAAIEAEQRRIAAEAAELERQKQAAVNPGNTDGGENPDKNGSIGAPSAMPPPDFVREAVWAKIEKAIENVIVGADVPPDAADIAAVIRKAITFGCIPHITVNYGEGNV